LKYPQLDIAMIAFDCHKWVGKPWMARWIHQKESKNWEKKQSEHLSDRERTSEIEREK
jgi:hypothetical protein